MTLTSDLYRLLDLAESERLDFPSLVASIGAAENDIVSCEAYAHPYGFSVFNLLQFGEGGLLRLHIWPRVQADQGVEDYLIHDHIYALTSVILCGSLAQTLFARSSNGNSTHAIFLGTYSQDSSTITRTEESARLIDLGTERFGPGDRYSLPAEKLHLVKVAQRTAATLVVTRRSASLTNPRIYGPQHGVDRITFVRERLGSETKKKLVTEMLNNTRAA